MKLTVLTSDGGQTDFLARLLLQEFEEKHNITLSLVHANEQFAERLANELESPQVVGLVIFSYGDEEHIINAVKRVIKKSPKYPVFWITHQRDSPKIAGCINIYRNVGSVPEDNAKYFYQKMSAVLMYLRTL